MPTKKNTPPAPNYEAGKHDALIRPYHDLLGEMSIQDIAEQLEISVEAVTDYKKRFWDPEPPEAAPAEPVPVVAAAVVDEADDEDDADDSDSDPSTRVEMSPEQEAEEQAIKEAQERAAKEAEVAAMRADPRIRAREDAMRKLDVAIDAAFTKLHHSDSPAEARQAWADLQAATAGDIPAAFLSESEAVADARAATAPPNAVRVVKPKVITGPDGRSWRLKRRDVYTRDRAAFLWEHHRALVEVYPPRG